jgi:hypothetical protein
MAVTVFTARNNMLFHTIKEIVLINAYWFSLPLIGYAILRVLSRNAKVEASVSRMAKLVLNQSLFVRYFASTACMVIVMALLALLCYLTKAPAGLFTAFYVILVVAAGLYLLRLFARHLFGNVDLDVFKLKDQSLFVKLVFVGMCLLVAVDFVFALYVKAYALGSADTYVHLSRMVEILNNGFDVQSGFFSNLPESGYHFNVVYSLYVPPAQLLHMAPFEVWQYSFGFFRILEWTAIFSFSWYVCAYWLRDKVNALLGAALTTIFAITYYSGAFFTAVYPNQMVVAWLMLLVMVLAYHEATPKMSRWPLILTALLVTMTHATYAMISAMFLALFLAIRLLVDRKALFSDKQRLLTYGLTVGMLLLGPLRTATFPSRMDIKSVEIPSFSVSSVGPFSIKSPVNIFTSPMLRISLLLIGMFGLVYLLFRLWNNKRQFAVAAALILFFPLIAYEPIGFMALHAIFPLWVIDRFTSMNVLVYLSFPLGIYGLLQLIPVIWNKWIKAKTPSWLFTRNTGMVIATLGIAFYGANYFVTSHQVLSITRDGNSHYYSFMSRTHTDFKDILKDDKVVVATPGDGYFLGAILPVDVMGVEPGHTPPAVDVEDRTACQAHVLKHLGYSDLAAANASYVAVAKYDPAYKRQRAIGDHVDYLHKVAENGDFYLYGFDKTKRPATANKPLAACARYLQLEKQ